MHNIIATLFLVYSFYTQLFEWWMTLALFFFGWFTWTFLEFLVHRFGYHTKTTNSTWLKIQSGKTRHATTASSCFDFYHFWNTAFTYGGLLHCFFPRIFDRLYVVYQSSLSSTLSKNTLFKAFSKIMESTGPASL